MIDMAQKTPVLRVTDLYKSFGGVHVLVGLELEIHDGELHALIGPNGAGKTTLFNVISGFIKASKGSIRFKGQEITTLPAFKRAHLGIGRTFQITTLFQSLSVLENLRLTLEALPQTRLPFVKSSRFSETHLERFREMLSTWGLWESRNMPVVALPYGIQRQLEIVMAILHEPTLLLLDEPMAGLEAGSRAAMTTMIKALSDRMTILIIEHDMDVALRLADRVTILHHGEIITQGSPDEIQNNSEVQRIYFGFEGGPE
jgi:branched-chain amino acid transport system ATP-binding protein